MDALGKLTGGIAHDFNNLLTGIITGIELLKKRLHEGRTDAVLRFADTALNSARSAASMTNRLLAFARQQPLDARPADLNDQIRSLEELLQRTIGEHISLNLELSEQGAVAQVDANQLESAILDLVINARDALPRGGNISIRTASVRSEGDADLADAARTHRPALPVLFMTGYAENAVRRDRFLAAGMDMVVKPFQIGELLGKVRQLLDQSATLAADSSD